MPAIKVKAMAKGTYGGHLRKPGEVFFLVDIKDKSGKVVHTAESALAIEGVHQGGWMERVGATVASESPEQTRKREEREAQAEADRMAKVNQGLDPDDPDAGKELMVNAAGTGQIEKPRGGMALKAKAGSNAGQNRVAPAEAQETSQSSVEMI